MTSALSDLPKQSGLSRSGRREQVFWGWGEQGAGPSALPAEAFDALRERLGMAEVAPVAPVELDEVQLPESALAAGVRARLEAVVGVEAVRDDREIRVLRAAGKSYLDLLAQRSGDGALAPDAVVAPGSSEEIAKVLGICNEANVGVVPFGGGTSVVGGVTPRREGLDATITLDLARLDRLASVSAKDLTAVIEPGMRLPEADHALAAHGFTLGHTPQSYEWASVGGCVATRSAGQASGGYGRIEDNVVAVNCVTPVGELATLAVPATAAGPQLREVVVGSEGALGVITKVAMRVFPLPEARHYEGWFFHSFQEGAEALRALAQGGLTPTVARLSDEDETGISLLMSGSGLTARAARKYVQARGYLGGCVMIVGWEGSEAAIAIDRGYAKGVLKQCGGMRAGERPGASWYKGRFAAPFLRDRLMDSGVFVETFETATQWSGIGSLHQSVRTAVTQALANRGTPPIVMGHISHIYATGASLYFTVLAAQDRESPVAQWEAMKAAAGGAIVANHGTISHHHAVGRDHRPWLDEISPLGKNLLRTIKDHCDPAGIMNPGKLVGR